MGAVAGEMIDAVAQAMTLTMQKQTGGTRFIGLWARLTPDDKIIARTLAVAAIKAMQDPTTTMVNDALYLPPRMGSTAEDRIVDLYQTMIRAALDETT